MDDDMRLSFVGPMPVKEFFRTFLPTPGKVMKKEKLAGFERVFPSGLEKKVYDNFVNVANSLCTVVKARNTSNDAGIEAGSKFKPDISFYDAEKPVHDEPVASFQQIELFVEFKRGPAADPFNDGSKAAFAKPSVMACATRGQMVVYATRLQMYQFRAFVFSVGVFGDVVRLFRWDRSGAIVSESIKCSEEGNRELSEFFYRLNLMDRAGRGRDPTISDATPEAAAALHQAIQSVIVGGKNEPLGELLGPTGVKVGYQRKVDVVQSSGTQKSYIVARSIVTSESPAGRSTRGFVAMDVETEDLVFLKDNWCPDIPGMRAGNTAAFLCGFDVGSAPPESGVTTRGAKKEKEWRNYSGARRTGTWQFISTESLARPGKIHELCDDLKSFFFVTLYYAMKDVTDIPQSVLKIPEKLKDCDEIIRFFDAALKIKGWPAECEKVADQYPATDCWSSEPMENVEISFTSRHLTAESSKSGKRKRGADDTPLGPRGQQRRKSKFKRS